MNSEMSHFERAYRREKQARRESEDLLEQKTRELHDANVELMRKHDELKWNQTLIVQSEKMSSLGQMAAGIAHEINNPVGFVLSNFNTLSNYVALYRHLLSYLDELIEASSQSNWASVSTLTSALVNYKTEMDLAYIGDDSIALLDETKEGLFRIRDIVSSLRSFSHVDEAELKVASINECIESTLKMVWNELKYKCTVTKELASVPDILCYAGQLKQVLMNLLVNAGQAIEARGEITIRTWADDKNVMVSFQDTGSGIDPANLDKLFNPFFTTKPIGKGTGLGLSISYGIIKRHGGKIDVTSKLGHGSLFTISLPIGGPPPEFCGQ